MNRPEFELSIRQLQINLTPEKYLGLTKVALDPTGRFDHFQLPPTYWQSLPVYRVAQCPLCGVEYSEALDTYSLHGWHVSAHTRNNVFSSKPASYNRCRHFVAVHTSINLNGLLPSEISYYKSGSDIPYVLSIFLPFDYPACAVLHSLPICRVENGQFVPRYTTYMLTYFAADPDLMWQRHHQELVTLYGENTDARPTWLDAVSDANLRQWVVNGKLQWLDLTSSDLPLKSGPPDEFPYTNIQGYGQRFTIWYGRDVQLG